MCRAMLDAHERADTYMLKEIYVPLQRPLIPMHLFANKDFVVVNILSAVGGVVYYSANSKKFCAYPHQSALR